MRFFGVFLTSSQEKYRKKYNRNQVYNFSRNQCGIR